MSSQAANPVSRSGFCGQQLRRTQPRKVWDGRGFRRGGRAYGVLLDHHHGSTDKRAPPGFAPIAIGLALTLIHLIGIPVTNLSVNPARSTGPALIVGGWAIAQLWLFWVAPLLGGAIGGMLYKTLFEV